MNTSSLLSIMAQKPSLAYIFADFFYEKRA